MQISLSRDLQLAATNIREQIQAAHRRLDVSVYDVKFAADVREVEAMLSGLLARILGHYDVAAVTILEELLLEPLQGHYLGGAACHDLDPREQLLGDGYLSRSKVRPHRIGCQRTVRVRKRSAQLGQNRAVILEHSIELIWLGRHEHLSAARARVRTDELCSAGTCRSCARR